MKAARMHEYGKALILEDIPIPEIQPDEILVRVKACGMCRSDVQLIDGYFRPYADIPPPITLGHEITGVIDKIGGVVPKAAGFKEGDHVVVAPGWGDGICRHCQIGNTHICPNVRWPGFGPVGGFAEFIPVPGRYLIRVSDKLRFEQLAPLTDAGLTPYRGIKKLRDSAHSVRTGSSAFSASAAWAATLFSTPRSSGAAPRWSPSRATSISSPSRRTTGRTTSSPSRVSLPPTSARNSARPQGDRPRRHHRLRGRPEMMQLAFSLLSISGHYADVGLVGDRIDIPLFPRISREQTFHGSFWGNYTDLSEVMALAAEGKIRHTLKMFAFDQINEYIERLRTGEVVGRAVMKF